MPLHIVLGGGGFLGRHLAMVLGRAGNRVIAVDRAFHGAAPAGVEQRQADLFAMSQEELCELVAGADVVQHLVWSSVPASANLLPERDACENLGFMIRILSAVRVAQARLVFASSGGTVYGSADVEALAEDHLLSPISIYGATKVSAEIYATVFRATYSVDVRIARLSNPFGIGQATSLLQGSVSRFVAKAVAGEVIEIWGDGEVVRDFIHVQDAVAGLARLGVCPKDVLGDGIFNIGSGTGTSLNEVIAILSDVLGRPVATRYQPARNFDVRRNVLDIGRAAMQLGWAPQLTLRQGVERMIVALRDGCSSIYSEIDVPEALSSQSGL